MQKLVREDVCGERPSQTIVERYKKETQIAFKRLCGCFDENRDPTHRVRQNNNRTAMRVEADTLSQRIQCAL